MENILDKDQRRAMRNSQGKIGYVFLWLLGAPIGFVLLLWVLLGNNIFGPG